MADISVQSTATLQLPTHQYLQQEHGEQLFLQPTQPPIRQNHVWIPQPHYMGGGNYHPASHHQPPKQLNHAQQPCGPMPQSPRQQPGAPPYAPENINALQMTLQLWKISNCSTIIVIQLFWPKEQSKEVLIQRATALVLQWIPTGNQIFFFCINVFNNFCFWFRQNVPSPCGPQNSANLNGTLLVQKAPTI